MQTIDNHEIGSRFLSRHREHIVGAGYVPLKSEKYIPVITLCDEWLFFSLNKGYRAVDLVGEVEWRTTKNYRITASLGIRVM